MTLEAEVHCRVYTWRVINFDGFSLPIKCRHKCLATLLLPVKPDLQ